MSESKDFPSKKKHIVGILYGTELFGRERENIECYKALKSLGFDIKVFGSYREEEGGKVGLELKRLGIFIDLLPFGSHFALAYFRSIKGYWRRQIQRIYNCCRIIKKHIQSQKPIALFMGSHTEYLYLWPLLLFNRIAVIYRVGDGPIWDSQFHKYAMKQLLKRANHIVPVSHFIAEQIKKLEPNCKSKTTVIWNIPPEFHDQHKPRVELDVNPSLRLLYVGQMTEKKGVGVLIEALIELKTSLKFKCRIVGGSKFSGPFEKEQHRQVIQAGLGDQIEFVGRVDDPTPHYDWANLHIAPSLYEEPFGLVIVEAKRAGIPSIIFPRGGMPELIEHGTNGWVCEQADSQSLADAIRICHSQPLNEWGQQAEKDHSENFSQARFQNDWSKLLEKL